MRLLDASSAALYSLLQARLGLNCGRRSARMKVFASSGAALGARAPTNGNAPQPAVSRRVASTDPPVVAIARKIVASAPGCMSLAQGIVHWDPPAEAVEGAMQAMRDGVHALSQYGADEGWEELRVALRQKLADENGLPGHDVFVTAGANQAFTDVVLTLLDASDTCVLFKPVYFNHQMALQMTGGGDRILHGPCDPETLHPDLGWLEQQLAGPQPPKMVVITSPCNPTGVLMRREEMQRCSDLCAKAGAWLVCDNTYEHFVYGSWPDGSPRKFEPVSGPHVVHIFSFSKAWGMMGWRVGYVAWQAEVGDWLSSQMLKVQDTNPICAALLSQRLALGALLRGRAWVEERVEALEPSRRAVLEALSPLGTLGRGVAGGEGAIYFWARLPPGCEDDYSVNEWLARKHGVCVIPGTACGTPGHIRVAYANLAPEATAEAAKRLRAGLEELVAGGFGPVQRWLEEHRQQQQQRKQGQ